MFGFVTTFNKCLFPVLGRFTDRNWYPWSVNQSQTTLPAFVQPTGRNGFHIFYGCGEKIKRKIFCDINSNINVSTQRFIGTQPRFSLNVFPYGCFCATTTQLTLWTQSLKFTIWPFTEKILPVPILEDYDFNLRNQQRLPCGS